MSFCIMFLKRLIFKNKYKDKKWLEDNYLKSERGMKRVAERCGSTLYIVRKWIIKYNIPMKSKGFKSKRKRKGLSKKLKGKCGELNYNWKGGKRKTNKGYTRIYKPKHPYCDCRNCVLEHRLIMEKHLGRYLTKYEVVHHNNGIKSDNRLKNLSLFKTANEHNKYHRERGEKSYKED